MGIPKKAKKKQEPLDRESAFKLMAPATKELATEGSTMLVHNAQGGILTAYDLGCRLIEVIGNEPHEADQVVNLLSVYWGYNKSDLYDWRNLATDFPGRDGRAYLAAKSNRPTKKGRYLTVMHWVHLRRLNDRHVQEAMLKRVYDEDLSAREVRQEVASMLKIRKKDHHRAGGRKPGQPSSPSAGLKRFTDLANKLVRYVPIVDEFVFEALRESPATDPEVKEAISVTSASMIEHIGKLREEFDRIIPELDALVVKPPKPRLARSTGRHKATTASLRRRRAVA